MVVTIARTAIRLRSLAVVAILAAVALGGSAVPALANQVTIPAQGGNSKSTVTPGTVIYAGYDFSTVAGATTFVNGGSAVLDLSCSNHNTPNPSTMTIIFPNATYIDSSMTSQGWTPSGDQSSSLVYQGSAPAPDACGGGTMVIGNPNMGPFTADIASTNTTTKINVRWHYGLASNFSSNGGTGTSWSVSVGVYPDTQQVPVG